MSGDADLLTLAWTLDDPDLSLFDRADLEAAKAGDDDTVPGHECVLYRIDHRIHRAITLGSGALEPPGHATGEVAFP